VELADTEKQKKDEGDTAKKVKIDTTKKDEETIIKKEEIESTES